jgi:hypothetical protein
MDSKTARIRALNDELRQNFAGGVAVMTPGIAALGAEAVARIVKTIGVFDDFCHATTRMKSTTLARSTPTATGCFSRSTTSTRASRTTLLKKAEQTEQLPNFGPPRGKLNLPLLRL